MLHGASYIFLLTFFLITTPIPKSFANKSCTSIKQTCVLIVDDDESVRAVFAMMLARQHTVHQAGSAAEALAFLKEQRPNVILLDHDLADSTGLDLLKKIRAAEEVAAVRPIQIIVITGSDAAEAGFLQAGANDFLLKPVNVSSLFARVNNLAQLDLRHAQLLAFDKALSSIVAAIDARDDETGAHSQRVAQTAVRLGRLLGLGEEELRILQSSALLHDIGKIAIRDEILLKTSKLTPEEYEVIKTHPIKGEEIAGKLAPFIDTSVIRSHHERYDGKGYPDGKAGECISLSARIVAIADSHDAIRYARTYKGAVPVEKVKQTFRENSGQWDPELVEIFLKNYEALTR